MFVSNAVAIYICSRWWWRGGGHGGGTVGSGGSDTFKRSISSLLSFLSEAFTD